MSVDPVVTVVLRSHQRGRLQQLQRALFSVWSQDLAECVELLLITSGYSDVLDASICTAHLGEASSNYVTIAPRLFRHITLKLSGDTRARLLNAGLQHANGQYLFFLDDDDVLREDALRRLLTRARETASDLVLAGVDLVIDLPTKRFVAPYASQRASKLNLLQHNTAPLCSFLLKRPKANALPFVDETLCSHEDYAMLLKVLSTATVAELTDSHAVAEYWLTLGGKSQAEKYANALANDMSCILQLKNDLQFSLSGKELTENTSSNAQEQANAMLLNTLPIDDTALTARVEQIVATRFGTIYLGWAITTAVKETSTVPYVFAINPQGLAKLVTVRFPRVDLVAIKGLTHKHWGFSFLSNETMSHFVAVSGNKKIVIPLPVNLLQ